MAEGTKIHRAAVLALTAALASAAAPKTTAAVDPARIDALLAKYHEVGGFNGAALVAEGGKVVLKKGYGDADFEWKVPNTPATRFKIGSMTKQFTSMLILQLVDEKKLTLDTKLSDALPYYRKDTGSRVTIKQLLHHTSGIPSYTDSPEFWGGSPYRPGNAARYPHAVREVVEKYCSGDLQFEPGRSFRYSNSNYFLLGAVVEQATGSPYDQVLTAKVFTPAGMASSGYDWSRTVLERRARGYDVRFGGVQNAPYIDMSLPYAAGALYSTVEDLYAWDQALHSEKLLSAEAKKLLFEPGLADYACAWFVQKDLDAGGGVKRTALTHGGAINGFTSMIFRVPDDRHLIVLLNNSGFKDLIVIQRGIVDLLYGREPVLPKRSVGEVLYRTIGSDGVAKAIAQYRELKTNRSADYDFSELQLDLLADELMEENRSEPAIEIYKLNAEIYPSPRTEGALARARQPRH